MSTLKADTIQSTGGGAVTLTKQIAIKAYVDFDGTAGTVAARGSFNTASLTDHGSGDYTQTFSSVFANNDYSSWMNCTQEAMASNNVSIGINEGTRPTTSALRCLIQRDSGTDVNEQDVNYGSVGDLA